MPVVGSSRKKISELLLNTSTFDDEFGLNYHLATVGVEAASNTDEVPIGIPLVYDGTAGAFVRYLAQDISAVTSSSLPDDSPICIAVGAKEGLGFNKEDVTLSTTATNLTVIFRGPAGLLNEGIDWGSATGPNQIEFRTQMEKQGLSIQTRATAVTPSFVS